MTMPNSNPKAGGFFFQQRRTDDYYINSDSHRGSPCVALRLLMA
jgi:hypothetical protein